MAQSIQHDQATLILELSAASTPNIHSPITSPGSQLRDAIVSIPLVQNIRQVTLSPHCFDNPRRFDTHARHSLQKIDHLFLVIGEAIGVGSCLRPTEAPLVTPRSLNRGRPAIHATVSQVSSCGVGCRTSA